MPGIRAAGARADNKGLADGRQEAGAAAKEYRDAIERMAQSAARLQEEYRVRGRRDAEKTWQSFPSPWHGASFAGN